MNTITLDTASKLIARALSQASADYQRPICVAVCDGTGTLIAFARVDGAPLRSVQISIGKAYSSARLGVHTDAFLERLHREKITASDFCDDKITSLPGGAVLKSQSGEVIGAVGVSGLKSEEDQAIVHTLAGLVGSGTL
ncbi:MAG: heme-binding protein [Rhodoplanes sp.]|uniref:GlcG/HbpS family heme-binding protein n=1 Tax=Rhodoplanes sp. TaxID=1968906 RepID=UPI001800B70D|nr:heme-binding protein [Rhodoplanes sp.]NVO13069.1 heme-binding protein [Rhodoplanes sp.]